MMSDEATDASAGDFAVGPGGCAGCLWLIAGLRALQDPSRIDRFRSAANQGSESPCGEGSPCGDPCCELAHTQLQRWLAHAELSGQISEFCALSVHALLELSQESGFATDYLDMAEAVAASPHDRAIVAKVRIAHDWLQAHPSPAIDQVPTKLARDPEGAQLWNELLVALSRSATRAQKLADPRAA